MNERLTAYIKKMLAQGHSRQKIRQALKKGHWTDEDISQAFAALNTNTNVSETKENFINQFIHLIIRPKTILSNTGKLLHKRWLASLHSSLSIFHHHFRNTSLPFFQGKSYKPLQYLSFDSNRRLLVTYFHSYSAPPIP